MTTSTFPNGFANGVSIKNIPRLDMVSGNVFWVHSVTGSDTGNGTLKKPFATIDYAIGRCTASNGDIILVKEKHAETIVGVGGIACDVAGITIIGLGYGTQRPVITMTPVADTGSITISAAGVTLKNLVFSANFADIVTCLNITAAGVTLDSLDFKDTAVNMNFLTPIKATSTSENNADGLTIRNCRWVSVDAASLEFIELNANVDSFTATGNFVATKGTASPFLLQAGTKILTGCLIMENNIASAMTANDLFIDNGGSTGQHGIVKYNFAGSLDTTTTVVFGAAAGLFFAENLVTGATTLTGTLSLDVETPLT